jgi:glycosyltransferase involved in cell wall biosynthesis
MDLTIIIPVYNEEGNIGLLYERLTKVMQSLSINYELLFVNDGSRDNSILLVKELATGHPEVKYIDFSRNFGHQVAVSAGLDKSKGNAVAIIDADLQDPPELIVDLYNKMQEGFEVVYARRRTRKGESLFKLWTAKLFYRLLTRITSIPIPVDTGDFRVIDRKIVDILNDMPEKEKYLRGQISWIGFRQTFIEYDRQERHSGTTGYPFSKMFKFAIDGITGFSNFPLKIVSFFGFITSGIAFVVTLYALYARFILKDYQPGWASLMVSILFIGGIQLISLGIIGEYLSRMNSNIRDRPLYIVRDTNC